MKSYNLQYRHVFPTLFFSSLLASCNSQPTQQVQSGLCPQDRTTEYAPASIAAIVNPLIDNEENRAAGEKLYQKSSTPVACATCHGENGDGNGRMAHMFEPAPRNFTCSDAVGGLPDGQIFWVIKNGSIGTSMPAFFQLTDKQIWQLTIYLRSLEIRDTPLSGVNASSDLSSSALCMSGC